ncbi:MAG: sugar ABC transporter ATP-binding protein [Candidatus Atribacteria bacterium]|nr:sugar ABC transporter ATP-binding protein [Candidatus Atribacteria bacterium]
MTSTKTVIEMKNVSKYFGAVKALENVSLQLYSQEILGLVGDNAAGKSTLLKILSGVHLPNKGQIFVEGKDAEIRCPMDARRVGIETVYQDFMLAPNLDIVANIFLGRELTRWGRMEKLHKKQMEKKAAEILKDLNADLGPLSNLVMSLSGGQQQLVAIARALLYSPKVILMDEPTASLSVRAIEPFLELVKNLKAKGCSIIYVSHRLPDVLEISDRIVVLRAGQLVAEKMKDSTSLEEVVYFMMGIENQGKRKISQETIHG